MSTPEICLSIFSGVFCILFGALLKLQANTISDLKSSIQGVKEREIDDLRKRVTQLEVTSGEVTTGLNFIKQALDEIKKELKELVKHH